MIRIDFFNNTIVNINSNVAIHFNSQRKQRRIKTLYILFWRNDETFGLISILIISIYQLWHWLIYIYRFLLDISDITKFWGRDKAVRRSNKEKEKTLLAFCFRSHTKASVTVNALAAEPFFNQLSTFSSFIVTMAILLHPRLSFLLIAFIGKPTTSLMPGTKIFFYFFISPSSKKLTAEM